MLTLFHAPRSRSRRFIYCWRNGSGAVDPDDPHPLGKVPALIHDDVTVFESCAIARKIDLRRCRVIADCGKAPA